MTQEALKLALECAERCEAIDGMYSWSATITAIKEALAQTQEPVAHWSDCSVHSEPAYPKGECDCGGFNPTAWLVEDADGSHLYWAYKEPIGNEKWTPLFATPPQRTERPVDCERCTRLEEQAYDLVGKLRVANIKLSMQSKACVYCGQLVAKENT